MKKIKFAVIGFGHIGKRHVEMINRNPNADVVAIIDINKDLKKLVDKIP